MITITMFIGLFVTIVLANVATQIGSMLLANSDWYLKFLVKRTVKANKEVTEELERTTDIEELE